MGEETPGLHADEDDPVERESLMTVWGGGDFWSHLFADRRGGHVVHEWRGGPQIEDWHPFTVMERR